MSAAACRPHEPNPTHPGPAKRASRGLASLVGACLIGAVACDAVAPPRARPDIVLITLESLRPDHVGSYSGSRPTTPALDRLASEAVVYENAHAVTSWTLASHASLFTGLYPSAHGATRPRSRLSSSATTLAEILAANGYQTAGVISGPYLARQHALDQGFRIYDDSTATVGTQGRAHLDVTNPRMEATLKQFLESGRDPSRPLFLFAYFWDPHYDYIPPAPYDEMFVGPGDRWVNVNGYESSDRIDAGLSPAELSYVLAQYDGEIRWTDDHLGRLFDLLERLGLWRDAVVIVTSDHGEEFFDHGGKGHKRTLYEERVHVPLYIKFPGNARTGRDARLVSLVDLFPTILELAGVTSPPRHQGRSLLASDPDPDRAILMELLSTFYNRSGEDGEWERVDDEWVAIVRGNDKLVFRPGTGRTELYDLAEDPDEQADVSDDDPERTRALLGRLEALRRESLTFGGGDDASPADLDAEQLDRLRALGYLDENPGAPPHEPGQSKPE